MKFQLQGCPPKYLHTQAGLEQVGGLQTSSSSLDMMLWTKSVWAAQGGPCREGMGGRLGAPGPLGSIPDTCPDSP